MPWFGFPWKICVGRYYALTRRKGKGKDTPINPQPEPPNGLSKSLPSETNYCLTVSGPLVINGSRFAQIAQSVEQRTENPRVGSSILSLGTNKINGLRQYGVTRFLLVIYYVLLRAGSRSPQHLRETLRDNRIFNAARLHPAEQVGPAIISLLSGYRALRQEPTPGLRAGTSPVPAARFGICPACRSLSKQKGSRMFARGIA